MVTWRFPSWYASIAMPKKSPYTIFLRKVVETLRETGQLALLWQRHKYKRPQCYDPYKKGRSLGIVKLGSAFFIVIVGIAASFLICLFEFLMKRCKISNGQRGQDEDGTLYTRPASYTRLRVLADVKSAYMEFLMDSKKDRENMEKYALEAFTHKLEKMVGNMK